MAWTDDMSVAHEFVLGGGGDSIEMLIVGDTMFNKERDGAKMVDDFFKYCPNVSSLSVCEYDRIWTRKFEGQLVVLEIATGYYRISDKSIPLCYNRGSQRL